MVINKIVVKKYKLLKNVSIPINPEMNIFVGNNDSGKSTILEAIAILTTGKLNDYYFDRQLKASMFNNEARAEFIDSLNKGKKIYPPEIVFEAYFDGDPVYSGSNNTQLEDSTGINITVKLAQKNIDLYEQMLNKGDVKDIPIELYDVEYHSFSGEQFTHRYGPFKSVFIDTTRKNYSSLMEHFVTDIIAETATDEQVRDLSIAYGKSRRYFREDKSIRQLNNSLKEKATVKNREVTLDLKEDEAESWKKQMSVVIDEIPFENIGFGSQNTIKIELALRNAEEQANVVIMEEPENNLSFSNMAKLVSNIANSQNKQVFISTHSSFIANKLSLSNVHLVESGTVRSYDTLPVETKKYFIKRPGYDTLRFLLSSKVVLVEGITDDLIIQRAFQDKYGKLPAEEGIDIITVDSLAFKRFCDIALMINKPVVIVTDNDGNIEKNIIGKYRDYQNSIFTYYYEHDKDLHTIEPSVLHVNLDSEGQPSVAFRRAISVKGSMLDKSYTEILNYMFSNKGEWAYRVFESSEKIVYPEYIKNVITHFQ